MFRMFGFMSADLRETTEIQSARSKNEMWKDRFSILYDDIKILITHKEKKIDKLTSNFITEYAESLNNELKCLDELRSLELTCDTCQHDYVHTDSILSYEIIEQISTLEKLYYKILMSDKNYSVLLEEQAEKKRLNDQKDFIISEVDRLWDDGASDLDIKFFIRNVLNEIYAKRSPQYINNLVNDYFLFINAEKPVRVFLNSQQIKNLKRSIYKQTKQEHQQKEQFTCVTCQDDFVDSDVYISLPCNHSFHENCIIPWLKMHVTCPVCRADVRSSY